MSVHLVSSGMFCMSLAAREGVMEDEEEREEILWDDAAGLLGEAALGSILRVRKRCSNMALILVGDFGRSK